MRERWRPHPPASVASACISPSTSRSGAASRSILVARNEAWEAARTPSRRLSIRSVRTTRVARRTQCGKELRLVLAGRRRLEHRVHRRCGHEVVPWRRRVERVGLRGGPVNPPPRGASQRLGSVANSSKNRGRTVADPRTAACLRRYARAPLESRSGIRLRPRRVAAVRRLRTYRGRSTHRTKRREAPARPASVAAIRRRRPGGLPQWLRSADRVRTGTDRPLPERVL